MRKITIPMILLCVSINAQTPSAREIIEKVDRNMSAESRVFTSKMIIHNPRNTRTIESKSWSMGENKSFTEYISPPREQGTKMLKLDNLLWIFSPENKQFTSVSGLQKKSGYEVENLKIRLNTRTSTTDACWKESITV